jgi:hypothetical protein
MDYYHFALGLADHSSLLPKPSRRSEDFQLLCRFPEQHDRHSVLALVNHPSRGDAHLSCRTGRTRMRMYHGRRMSHTRRLHLTQRLYKIMLDLQTGAAEDLNEEHDNWIHVVEEYSCSLPGR